MQQTVKHTPCQRSCSTVSFGLNELYSVYQNKQNHVAFSFISLSGYLKAQFSLLISPKKLDISNFFDDFGLMFDVWQLASFGCLTFCLIFCLILRDLLVWLSNNK